MANCPLLELQLEPAALARCDIDDMVAASQAISLKRIADTLEKLTGSDASLYGIGAEVGRGMGDHFAASLTQNGR